MVCRLTASPVLLLYLIIFQQSFNESMLFFCLNVVRLHYCKVSTIYIYSVIADVRLLLWQHIHSCSVRCTPRVYGSPTVQLAFAAHIE